MSAKMKSKQEMVVPMAEPEDSLKAIADAEKEAATLIKDARTGMKKLITGAGKEGTDLLEKSIRDLENELGSLKKAAVKEAEAKASEIGELTKTRLEEVRASAAERKRDAVSFVAGEIEKNE